MKGRIMTTSPSKQKKTKNKSVNSKKPGIKNPPLNSRDEQENNTDGILVETARKIESGVKVMGEKAADVSEKISEQTSDIAEKIYDKLKGGISDAYDVSSKTVSDVSKKTARYIEKYEDTTEIKKLGHTRDSKMQELGMNVFNLFKSKPRAINELLSNSKSQKILHELELLTREITKLRRRIKRKL
jgi:hypothetical protein